MNRAGTAVITQKTPDTGLFADWDAWVLVALAAFMFFCYWYGRRIRRRYRPREKTPFWWFTPNHLAPFSTEWKIQFSAGGIYTSAIMLASAALVMLYQFKFPERRADTHTITSIAFEFPGALFVFLTGLFSAISVINTICLLRNRVFEISSFKQMPNVIDGLVDEKSHYEGGGEAHETFFIDYVPVLGALSDERSYTRIIANLKEWVSEDTSVTHCLFLTPKDYCPEILVGTLDPSLEMGLMEKMVEEMVAKSKALPAVDKYQFMVSESYAIFTKWEGEHTAIWFAEKINFEHYMVGIDYAVAYYIIPEENETKNQIAGSMQTDTMHVDYLRRVCRTYVSQAITPFQATATGVPDGDDEWETRITYRHGQLSVERVLVQLFDGEKKPLGGEREAVWPVSRTRNLMPGEYSIVSQGLPVWLKIRLVKWPDVGGAKSISSPESFYVKVERLP